MSHSAGAGRAPAPLELDADVLVIGGGPAATWAALTARSEGARVLLVDKGFCGASGVAAAATIGHWWVPEEDRESAMVERDAIGANLSETDWMARTLEETWRRWPELASAHGYPAGKFMGRPTARGTMLCQGPVYLREMRRRVSHAGVRILDHSPALELLIDAHGAVGGAAGVQRQKGRAWTARAGAVVLATGGCCWRSGALGSNVDTGDGYLMAAEVGATLSGMEFSNYYGVVPVGGSLDKNGFYGAATFTDADGNVLAAGFGAENGIGGPRSWVLPDILDGPVFAIFDRAPEQARPNMRAAMPNFFMSLDRHGIDPFTQRFQIEYLLEGTTRGTGGLRPADVNCWTGIPGLWAAGDTVSREAIVGSASGAGAPNAAFTIGSGTWSGRAAAAHALLGSPERRAAQRLTPAGRVGLRPTAEPLPDGAWRELSVATENEILPVDKNAFRSAGGLAGSLASLAGIWAAASAGLGGSEDVRDRMWARETASMIATARWAYLSADQRTETRGMHRRSDFPESDPAQRQRILVTGVDDPVVEVAEIADPQLPYEDLERQAA